MNRLMMKLTIGSEAIFFLCLIVAYLYFWRSGNFQREVAEHLSIKSAGIFTAILLFSSFSFWQAERNHASENYKATKLWLIVTIILGVIFLLGQGHEYYKLIQENILISKSEFGSSFYTLTGFHGLHVLIGLIILLIVLALTMQGYLLNKNSSAIKTVGIYWHFVDAVWVFVFATIYVLPYIL
ncbi:MAG TPA: heme-copper oxidase subunit III [Flavisolibacter sp.]|nr:heme-copper oxidase subunit III [Flavisolibacter sp.]